jgi:hypothetical protein
MCVCVGKCTGSVHKLMYVRKNELHRNKVYGIRRFVPLLINLDWLYQTNSVTCVAPSVQGRANWNGSELPMPSQKIGHNMNILC